MQGILNLGCIIGLILGGIAYALISSVGGSQTVSQIVGFIVGCLPVIGAILIITPRKPRP